MAKKKYSSTSPPSSDLKAEEVLLLGGILLAVCVSMTFCERYFGGV